MTRNLRKQLRKIKIKRLEISMGKSVFYLEWYNLREKYYRLLDK
jgi:hypothetical protein